MFGALAAEDRVWLRASADFCSDQWTLRVLELVSGPEPPKWREIDWHYDDYVFHATTVSGRTAAEWLKQGTVHISGLAIPATFQQDVQQERRESGWGTNSSEPLEWPCQEWQLWPAHTPNSPRSGELLGEHLPYFASPDIPTAALLGVSYTGFNQHGREFLWRQQDTSGRLAAVRIDATEISVRVEADSAKGTFVELSSVEPGPTADVTDPKTTVTFALPNGLPDPSWIVLRRGDRWLDRRPLSWGWRNTLPGVEIVVPSEARLQALVAGGEDGLTEFKEQLPPSDEDGRRKVMKTVAAFANAAGGTILFGVPNEGVICGLPLEDEAPKRRDTLAQLVRDWVHPLPVFHIETLPAPDEPSRQVIALSVEAGDQQPYAAGTSPDRMTYYVRRGATTFPVMPDEVRALALRSQSKAQGQIRG